MTTYCGVNAHHQNGGAEKRIRDLQEQARKMLLHAECRWPKAIDTSLWTYALRLSNDITNDLPDRDYGSYPSERFGNVPVAPKVSEYHTLGCPVYVLRNELQQCKAVPKWKSRCRLGIYIGQSPRHACSVSLVLSLTTGLVSPQFHIHHDNFFKTIGKTEVTTSLWQRASGFKQENRSAPILDGLNTTDETNQSGVDAFRLAPDGVHIKSEPTQDHISIKENCESTTREDVDHSADPVHLGAPKDTFREGQEEQADQHIGGNKRRK